MFWDPQDALAGIGKSQFQHMKLVFVLSYRWLSKQHPDPMRHHLMIMARVFRLDVDSLKASQTQIDDIAVFWDFISVPQTDYHGKHDDKEEICEQHAT